jgi:hypothetical protein
VAVGADIRHKGRWKGVSFSGGRRLERKNEAGWLKLPCMLMALGEMLSRPPNGGKVGDRRGGGDWGALEVEQAQGGQ